MSTTNSERAKETSPRNTGFVKRLVAVLVFAALGTYAVLQTIPRQSSAGTGEGTTPAETQPLIAEGESVTPTGSQQITTQKVSEGDGATTTLPSLGSAFSPRQTAFDRPSSQTDTPAAPAPTNDASTSATSQANTTPVQPSSQGFGPPPSRSFGALADRDDASPQSNPDSAAPSAAPNLNTFAPQTTLGDDSSRQTIEGQNVSGSLPPLRGQTNPAMGLIGIEQSPTAKLNSDSDPGSPLRNSASSSQPKPNESGSTDETDVGSSFPGRGSTGNTTLPNRDVAGQFGTQFGGQFGGAASQEKPADVAAVPPESESLENSRDDVPAVLPRTEIPQREPRANLTDTPSGFNGNSFGQSPPTNEPDARPMVTGITPQQNSLGETGTAPAATQRTTPETFPRTQNDFSTPSSSIRLENANPVSLSAAPMNRATEARPGDRQLEGQQTPSLSIEKVAPEEIQVNQVAKFRLVVRNLGRVPAEEVVVDDHIPDATEFVASTPQPRQRGGQGQIQWHLGTLQPGEERTIEFDLRPTRPGEIGSVAQVSFATKASMRTTVTQPILSIEHTAPSTVLIGDRLTLDITVRNAGSGAAKDVIIQENVPPELSYSDEFRDLEYTVGTLEPGQSRRVQLTLQAVQVGRVRNIVQAVGGGLKAVQHATDIEIVAPQLQVASNGPQRRFLKRDAAYEFTVSNRGTATATNVDLVAKLPRGLRFVGANNQGQYDAGSNAVYWSLAQLAANQQATVTMDVVPVETGAQDIEFMASADLRQKDSLWHKLLVDHLVDVHFEIDDVDDHIEIGSQTDYRIRIVNQGTKPASNVRLTISMDPGIRPLSISGGLSADLRGQQVIFPSIANLNPGEELIVAVTGQGVSSGDHKISANLQSDGREIDITKEESTHVYADR